MRRIFVIVFVIVSVQQVSSQRSDLSFGLVPLYKANGYGVNLNSNYYHSVTDYYHLSLIATFSKEQPNAAVEFPYEDYLLNVGYITTILNWRNRGLSIFFGGGTSIGYELINNGEADILFINQFPESGFVYGGFASFEMDFFLSDSLSLVVPITGMYHFNSKVDNSILLLGVGIRFYLQ